MTVSEDNDHLSIRLDPDHKKLIEYAASLKGQTISDFVISATVRRVQQIIQEDQRIRLTGDDWEALADLLEDPNDDPNEALKRSVKRNPDVLDRLEGSS